MTVYVCTNYLELYHRVSQITVAKTPGIRYVTVFVDQEPGAAKLSSSSSESLKNLQPIC